MLSNDAQKYKEKLAKNIIHIADFEQVDLLLSDELLCNKYIVFDKIIY